MKQRQSTIFRLIDSQCILYLDAYYISGSLLLSGNPFRCGCHLAWLGHWLRRWMRESLQSHNAPLDTTVKLTNMMKEATCTEVTSGIMIPIVQLPPEDISCHASALSTAPNLNRTSVIFFSIILVILEIGANC